MRTLLSILFLVVTTYSFTQDSLFSKVYTPLFNHRYEIKAQTTDRYNYVAQVGQWDSNNATFTYLDSLGNILFSKEYSWLDDPSSGMQFRKIKSTSDGNFIVVGDLFMTNPDANIGICAKIDSTGNLLWSTTIVPANPLFFICSDVIESTENTFWVSGYDQQSGGLSILEIDQNGTQLQSYSFVNTGFQLENHAILELDTNQLALVGSQLDQNNNSNGYIISLDKSGNVLWSNNYNGIHFMAAQNDTNCIWVAGSHTFSNLAISKIDFNGSLINIVDYSNFDLYYSEYFDFICLKDSTFAVCKGSIMRSYVARIRANSTDAITFPIAINAVCVSPSKNDGIYLGGLGPVDGLKSNHPYYQSALVRMDSTLTVDYSCAYGPGPIDTINSTLTSNSLLLTATAPSSLNTTTLGVMNPTLNTQFGCVDVLAGLEEKDPNQLTISPNPATDFINIQFENATSGIIEIISMDGKLVRQAEVSGNNISVSVEKLVQGTYLYRFTSSRNIVSRGKLVIE